MGLVVALIAAMVISGAQFVGEDAVQGFEEVSAGLPEADSDPATPASGATPNAGGSGSGGGSSAGGGGSSPSPTSAPTSAPAPTVEPTPVPTLAPTPAPTAAPTTAPTPEPTAVPTPQPTAAPTTTPAAITVSANGFEDGRSNKFKKYKLGRTIGGGWRVTSGDVQTQRAGSASGISPTEGSRYIDLNGSKPGTISQSLDITANKTYTLTLDVASTSGGASGHRTAEIRWNGKVVATIDLAKRSSWRTITIELPAVNAKRSELELVSTNSGASGVYVDNINVTG